MKLSKVENRETEILIDPGILAREKRETTRKSNKAGEEKMKLGKVEIVKLRLGSNQEFLTAKDAKRREDSELKT